MSGMPIYSQVVPKSRDRERNRGSKPAKERPHNLPRDFDPLNSNHGGNIDILNAPLEARADRKEGRRKDDSGRTKKRTENEGKVEAYLRQNQVSMRQQQRHSVRQAEHRLNLRSLPLNEVPSPRGHERTPTERRLFPGEREREDRPEREHRRERDRDRDRENADADVTPLSPREKPRGMRKSSSAQKVEEPCLAADKRRFFCREWLFQKIALCLEQRPLGKCAGALILGEAGSGKTAICQELSSPGAGPQARQQRALHRRLLARHLLQSHSESSLRPGEFVRSLAMQILSHGLRTKREEPKQDNEMNRDNFDEDKFQRFETIPDDGEESSKPLLADSEDQRTDEDECLWPVSRGTALEGMGRRTIDRIHEREDYVDSIDAPLSAADHVPEILPRASIKPTNPFLEDHKDDIRLYENHENLFLRNVSSRQSKEMKNSRLVRQSSEPLTDKKTAVLQKSASTEQRTDLEDRKIENSPPKSRIPVANFKYPNKSELKLSSAENSPLKKHDHHSDDTKSSDTKICSPKESPKLERNIQQININKTDDILLDELKENAMKSPEKDLVEICDNNLNGKPNEAIELPEYENILKRDIIEDKTKVELEILLEKKRSQIEDVPPPIPSLPVSPRTLIANAYYEKLLAEPEIQQALLPSNLEKNPDECFKRALLFPLLEIDPPKQCLFILVDGIDEGQQPTSAESTEPSASVLELLSRHQHLLPPWLLLVATARRGRHRTRAKLFTGFRKIQLDELSRAHTAADVQRYVLARLDTEPRLRSRVSSDAVGGASGGAAAAAAALDHLRIKSDGCLLYLEKVLDGVADGFIALREIREIPGTLNGLYLWLAQRLFHGRRFAKVRLLLEVLLAARCGVTEEMLYKCLLTKEYSVSREDFNRRLHLLRRIVRCEVDTGYISIFHHSFACWLLDVKHCTRRYLCSRREGHAAIAMYYTLMAHRLSALEIHNYVYHMTQLEQHLAHQKKGKDAAAAAGSEQEQALDLHTLILLWVLDSGADIDAALRRDATATAGVATLPSHATRHTEILKCESKDNGPNTPGVEPTDIAVPLERLVPALGEWAGDAKVLTELLTLRTTQAAQTISEVPESEVGESETEEPEMPPIDPNAVFELVAKGDDDTLSVLLKRCPDVVSLRDGGGGTALHVAARAGRSAAAAALCAAGADLAAADADGWSPLRAAAWAGHPEVVDVLLEYGCDVDCVDADNRTALRAASWSGHIAVVKRLLNAGADPARADAEGRTPLMAAAYMGHADIVRALLAAGADPSHTDLDGRTALSVAALCAVGSNVATLLIERGADVNASDRDGATPLLVAALEGHTELCEVLLEAEADVEATDGMGRTALWGAAGAGHARTVRLLLFWGAQVDTMDPEGRTVLSAAAAQGNVEVVRQLLDRGLDEHHRDNSGWTPLHYAAFEGHEEVCDALLEAGARVDEADNEGKSALLLAAAEGHARLAAALVDRWGAGVDRRAHDGKTALRLAALEGHFDTVDILLERGADVDALDADRRSTLYVLALDNRLAMARHLLRTASADPQATDTEGRTPLHVSAWQGHTEMVNLLVKVGGASVDGRDRCLRTALHAAAWRGRTHALRALLSLGADPAARCSQGATPLGIAAQEGHEDCVVLLLQHGADPMQADHAGRTPAKVAWRAGHAHICRLLERWNTVPTAPPLAHDLRVPGSPEGVRRSVHSSSTKSSVSHELEHDLDLHLHHDKTNRANLSLSFAQQVARMGRGRRDKDRDSVILEHPVLEKDPNLRSYAIASREADLRIGVSADAHTGNTSPLYASPPRSPPPAPRAHPPAATAVLSPAPVAHPLRQTGAQPTATAQDDTHTHFNRDTHMRIILGRDKPPDSHDSKNKRNGIVTNPAMRLVANVRNGLDNAAANIRRTGVALAASASSANPVVKTNAFQWRKETPL